MGIKMIKVRTNKIDNKGTTNIEFIVNDVLVAECRIGWDYYCTISKSGNPSRIRDRRKRTFNTRWIHDGIKNLIGGDYESADFKNDGPDLTFGYQGTILTNKKVKEIFQKYL